MEIDETDEKMIKTESPAEERQISVDLNPYDLVRLLTKRDRATGLPIHQKTLSQIKEITDNIQWEAIMLQTPIPFLTDLNDGRPKKLDRDQEIKRLESNPHLKLKPGIVVAKPMGGNRQMYEGEISIIEFEEEIENRYLDNLIFNVITTRRGERTTQNVLDAAYILTSMQLEKSRNTKGYLEGREFITRNERYDSLFSDFANYVKLNFTLEQLMHKDSDQHIQRLLIDDVQGRELKSLVHGIEGKFGLIPHEQKVANLKFAIFNSLMEYNDKQHRTLTKEEKKSLDAKILASLLKDSSRYTLPREVSFHIFREAKRIESRLYAIPESHVDDETFELLAIVEKIAKATKNQDAITGIKQDGARTAQLNELHHMGIEEELYDKFVTKFSSDLSAKLAYCRLADEDLPAILILNTEFAIRSEDETKLPRKNGNDFLPIEIARQFRNSNYVLDNRENLLNHKYAEKFELPTLLALSSELGTTNQVDLLFDLVNAYYTTLFEETENLSHKIEKLFLGVSAKPDPLNDNKVYLQGIIGREVDLEDLDRARYQANEYRKKVETIVYRDKAARKVGRGRQAEVRGEKFFKQRNEHIGSISAKYNALDRARRLRDPTDMIFAYHDLLCSIGENSKESKILQLAKGFRKKYEFKNTDLHQIKLPVSEDICREAASKFSKDSAIDFDQLEVELFEEFKEIYADLRTRLDYARTITYLQKQIEDDGDKHGFEVLLQQYIRWRHIIGKPIDEHDEPYAHYKLSFENRELKPAELHARDEYLKMKPGLEAKLKALVDTATRKKYLGPVLAKIKQILKLKDEFEYETFVQYTVDLLSLMGAPVNPQDEPYVDFPNLKYTTHSVTPFVERLILNFQQKEETLVDRLFQKIDEVNENERQRKEHYKKLLSSLEGIEESIDSGDSFYNIQNQYLELLHSLGQKPCLHDVSGDRLPEIMDAYNFRPEISQVFLTPALQKAIDEFNQQYNLNVAMITHAVIDRYESERQRAMDDLGIKRDKSGRYREYQTTWFKQKKTEGYFKVLKRDETSERISQQMIQNDVNGFKEYKINQEKRFGTTDNLVAFIDEILS